MLTLLFIIFILRCILIAADYSQIELRVLAHLSGDEVLIQGFTSRGNFDIHTHVASIIHGLTIYFSQQDNFSKGKKHEDVTPDDRSSAKRVVFGILYGMRIKTLAKNLSITDSQAGSLYKSFFSKVFLFFILERF